MHFKRCLQFITCVTLGVFSVNTVALSAPLAYSIRVPEERGSVTSRYLVPQARAESRTIVLIQDAHSQLGAQHNVSALIQSVISQIPQVVSQEQSIVVGMEGAVGTVQTSSLRSFPFQSVRKVASDHLLKQGYLTASEHASLVSLYPFVLVGVEDKDLLQKSIMIFQELYAQKDALSSSIHTEKDRLEKQLTTTHHEALLELYGAYKLYRDHTLDIEKFVSLLIEDAEAQHISLDPYVHLMMMMDSLRADAQKSSLTIDPVRLYEDIGSLLWACMRARVDSASERELLDKIYAAELLEKICLLEATRNDIALFKAEEIRDHYQWDREVKHAIDKAMSFYELASQRDEHMLSNLCAEINARSAEGKQGIGILVAGGFHTKGIQQLLEERGINYVVVTPTVSLPGEPAGYVERMLGKLSPVDAVRTYALPHSYINANMESVLGTLGAEVVKSYFGEVWEGVVAASPDWASFLYLIKDNPEIPEKARQDAQAIYEIVRDATGTALTDPSYRDLSFDEIVEKINVQKKIRTVLDLDSREDQQGENGYTNKREAPTLSGAVSQTEYVPPPLLKNISRHVPCTKGDRSADLYLYPDFADALSQEDKKEIEHIITTNHAEEKEERSVEYVLKHPIGTITRVQIKGVLFDAQKEFIQYAGVGAVDAEESVTPEGTICEKTVPPELQGGSLLTYIWREFYHTHLLYKVQREDSLLQVKSPLGWARFPELTFQGKPLGCIILGMNEEAAAHRGHGYTSDSFYHMGKALAMIHAQGITYHSMHEFNVTEVARRVMNGGYAPRMYVHDFETAESVTYDDITSSQLIAHQLIDVAYMIEKLARHGAGDEYVDTADFNALLDGYASEAGVDLRVRLPQFNIADLESLVEQGWSTPVVLLDHPFIDVLKAVQEKSRYFSLVQAIPPFEAVKRALLQGDIVWSPEKETSLYAYYLRFQKWFTETMAKKKSHFDAYERFVEVNNLADWLYLYAVYGFDIVSFLEGKSVSFRNSDTEYIVTPGYESSVSVSTALPSGGIETVLVIGKNDYNYKASVVLSYEKYRGKDVGAFAIILHHLLRWLNEGKHDVWITVNRAQDADRLRRYYESLGGINYEESPTQAKMQFEFRGVSNVHILSDAQAKRIWANGTGLDPQIWRRWSQRELDRFLRTVSPIDTRNLQRILTDFSSTYRKEQFREKDFVPSDQVIEFVFREIEKGLPVGMAQGMICCGDTSLQRFNEQKDSILKKGPQVKLAQQVRNVYKRYLSDLENYLLPSQVDELHASFDRMHVYGVESMVVDTEDFFFGLFDKSDLFLAEDFIAHGIRSGKESLVDEYILHELLCPFLGHNEAIYVQQKLFPLHYQLGAVSAVNHRGKWMIPTDAAGDDEYVPFKGGLGVFIRDTITMLSDHHENEEVIRSSEGNLEWKDRAIIGEMEREGTVVRVYIKKEESFFHKEYEWISSDVLSRLRDVGLIYAVWLKNKKQRYYSKSAFDAMSTQSHIITIEDENGHDKHILYDDRNEYIKDSIVYHYNELNDIISETLDPEERKKIELVYECARDYWGLQTDPLSGECVMTNVMIRVLNLAREWGAREHAHQVIGAGFLVGIDSAYLRKKRIPVAMIRLAEKITYMTEHITIGEGTLSPYYINYYKDMLKSMIDTPEEVILYAYTKINAYEMFLQGMSRRRGGDAGAQQKMKRQYEEAIHVVAAVLQEYGLSELAREFKRRYYQHSNPEEYAKLVHERNHAIQLTQETGYKYLGELEKQIIALLKRSFKGNQKLKVIEKDGVEAIEGITIKYRVKDAISVAEKKERGYTKMHDVLAIRIVVGAPWSEDDCRIITSILQDAQFLGEYRPERWNDYIAHPRNGYRALQFGFRHEYIDSILTPLLVSEDAVYRKGADGNVDLEIQIRTVQMDMAGRYGPFADTIRKAQLRGHKHYWFDYIPDIGEDLAWNIAEEKRRMNVHAGTEGRAGYVYVRIQGDILRFPLTKKGPTVLDALCHERMGNNALQFSKVRLVRYQGKTNQPVVSEYIEMGHEKGQRGRHSNKGLSLLKEQLLSGDYIDIENYSVNEDAAQSYKTELLRSATTVRSRILVTLLGEEREVMMQRGKDLFENSHIGAMKESDPVLFKSMCDTFGITEEELYAGLGCGVLREQDMQTYFDRNGSGVSFNPNASYAVQGVRSPAEYVRRAQKIKQRKGNALIKRRFKNMKNEIVNGKFERAISSWLVQKVQGIEVFNVEGVVNSENDYCMRYYDAKKGRLYIDFKVLAHLDQRDPSEVLGNRYLLYELLRSLYEEHPQRSIAWYERKVFKIPLYAQKLQKVGKLRKDSIFYGDPLKEALDEEVAIRYIRMVLQENSAGKFAENEKPLPAKINQALDVLGKIKENKFDLFVMWKKVQTLLLYRGESEYLVNLFAYKSLCAMSEACSRNQLSRVYGLAGELSGLHEIIIKRKTEVHGIRFGDLVSINETVRRGEGYVKEFDAVSENAVFEFKYRLSLRKLYQQVIGIDSAQTSHVDVLTDMRAYQEIHNLVYFGEHDGGTILKALIAYLENKSARDVRNIQSRFLITDKGSVSVKFTEDEMQEFLCSHETIALANQEGKFFDGEVKELQGQIQYKMKRARKNALDIIVSVNNTDPNDCKRIKTLLQNSPDAGKRAYPAVLRERMNRLRNSEMHIERVLMTHYYGLMHTQTGKRFVVRVLSREILNRVDHNTIQISEEEVRSMGTTDEDAQLFIDEHIVPELMQMHEAYNEHVHNMTARMEQMLGISLSDEMTMRLIETFFKQRKQGVSEEEKDRIKKRKEKVFITGMHTLNEDSVESAYRWLILLIVSKSFLSDELLDKDSADVEKAITVGIAPIVQFVDSLSMREQSWHEEDKAVGACLEGGMIEAERMRMKAVQRLVIKGGNQKRAFRLYVEPQLKRSFLYRFIEAAYRYAEKAGINIQEVPKDTSDLILSTNEDSMRDTFSVSDKAKTLCFTMNDEKQFIREVAVFRSIFLNLLSSGLQEDGEWSIDLSHSILVEKGKNSGYQMHASILSAINESVFILLQNSIYQVAA